MKLIKGERSEFEKLVLKVLMDPRATHTQMDEAVSHRNSQQNASSPVRRA
jgi:hypothetical protein